jgi:hypothetical protein
MDQGAPPSAPLTPAPTREVVGDLLLAFAKLSVNVRHQNTVSMAQNLCLRSLIEGDAEAARTYADAAEEVLARANANLDAAWTEVEALIRRFAGGDDDRP